MKKTLSVIVALVLLGMLLGGCFVDPSDPSEWPSAMLIMGAVPSNLFTGGTSGPEDLTTCAEQGFALVAVNFADGGLWYRWYRNGEALGEPSQEWLSPPSGDSSASVWITIYPTVTGIITSTSGSLFPTYLTMPGTYSMRMWGADGSSEEEPMEVRTVVVPSCGADARSDVSVVIYGGWDGIPVKAYVGGAEQETLYTARDASGEAAVLWTFYPPAGQAWNVNIQPQTPPGKDPARWQYKLLRSEGPTPGEVLDNSPSGSDASIASSGQYKLYFQLLDMGPQAGQ